MVVRLATGLLIAGAVSILEAPPSAPWGGDLAPARVILVGIDANVH
jgi:hypothetical protein